MEIGIGLPVGYTNGVSMNTSFASRQCLQHSKRSPPVPSEPCTLFHVEHLPRVRRPSICWLVYDASSIPEHPHAACILGLKEYTGNLAHASCPQKPGASCAQANTRGQLLIFASSSAEITPEFQKIVGENSVVPRGATAVE